VRTNDGDRRTIQLGQDADIRRRGRAAQWRDLQQGDEVRVTLTDQDSQRARAVIANEFGPDQRFRPGHEGRRGPQGQPLPPQGPRSDQQARNQEAALGVLVRDAGPIGPWVSSVRVGSPASQAGIQPDDYILEMNGQKVKSTDQLLKMVSAHRPGDRVEVTVLRDYEVRNTRVQLAPRGQTFAGLGTQGPQQQYRGYRGDADMRREGDPRRAPQAPINRPPVDGAPAAPPAPGIDADGDEGGFYSDERLEDRLGRDPESTGRGFEGAGD